MPVTQGNLCLSNPFRKQLGWKLSILKITPEKVS